MGVVFKRGVAYDPKLSLKRLAPMTKMPILLAPNMKKVMTPDDVSPPQASSAPTGPDTSESTHNL